MVVVLVICYQRKNNRTMNNLLNRLFHPKADLGKLLQADAVVIDVRTKGEYGAGHIEGSRNIPLDEIRTEIKSLKQLNKPIITVCHSGNRSGMAKSILTLAGLEVYNGGAWTSLKNQIQ